MPEKGLEPSWVAPLAPKASASTNFATQAYIVVRSLKTENYPTVERIITYILFFCELWSSHEKGPIYVGHVIGSLFLLCKLALTLHHLH